MLKTWFQVSHWGRRGCFLKIKILNVRAGRFTKRREIGSTGIYF